MRRNISRVKALVELYQYDLLNKETTIDEFDQLLSEVEDLENDYDKEFAKQVFEGVIQNINRIDNIIAICLEKYPLERLSYIDRNLLRIGTYELLYTKTPKQIIINEIVNLSKEYSQTDDFKSSSFNNSVLDSISKRIEKMNK